MTDAAPARWDGLPGMDVLDVFAGGGYTTEILARIVGPEGSVVAQNNAWVLDRFARGPLEQRLARLAMPNVTAHQAELDAPIPPGTHDLDARHERPLRPSLP